MNTETKEFIINLPKRKACNLIKEYYRKYEDFDGEITFKKRSQDDGENWGGFRDYLGRIDMIFSKKKIIFGETIIEKTVISHKDVPLKEIFSTMLEDADYVITGATFNVFAYNEKDIVFNGVHLMVKKKSQNKILKK